MPRFLYSVVFTTLFSGGVLLHTLFTKSPNEQTNVFILILALFFFCTAFISLCIYFFARTKLSHEKEQRLAYRKALKKSLAITVYLLGLVVLKYLQLFNITTGGLFTILYLFGSYLLRKSSR